MIALEYTLIFEQFGTAEIDNSSLIDYEKFINLYFSREKKIPDYSEIIENFEQLNCAEIDNPFLEDFERAFQIYFK
ncbi:MAG: hypothetical protein ACFE8T_04135 [Promethearchaeota archaeon]